MNFIKNKLGALVPFLEIDCNVDIIEIRISKYYIDDDYIVIYTGGIDGREYHKENASMRKSKYYAFEDTNCTRFYYTIPEEWKDDVYRLSEGKEPSKEFLAELKRLNTQVYFSYVKNYSGYEIYGSVIDHNDICNIDIILESCKFASTDMFLQDNGKVKQYQNLHTYPEVWDYLLNIFKKVNKVVPMNKLLNVQVFQKWPGSDITKPHQDGWYFNQLDSNLLKCPTLKTCWIPLCDVDEKNSCMYYYTGSHLSGEIYPHDEGGKWRIRTGVKGYAGYTLHNLNDSAWTPVPLSAGDMVVHLPFTLHYSSKNNSNMVRRALTFIGF